MTLQISQNGFCQTNCYLLSTDTAAVIIDPGEMTDKIYDFCFKNRDKQSAVLLTHAHFDHFFAAEEVKNIMGCDIFIGENDKGGLKIDLTGICEVYGIDFKPLAADRYLSDNEKFSIGDIDFEVIYTPGHTLGSVCYKTEDMIFTGDTVFFMSFGRTDFKGSSSELLKKSIDKLFDTDKNYKLLPGHGEMTDIYFEKSNNPYSRML